MTDTELAWAAGFFDGEGSCSLRTKQGTRPGMGLQLGQKGDPQPLLERFQRAVGGIGRIYPPYPGGHGMSVWATYSYPKVCRVMELLWPYLGEVKRAQFLAAQAAVLATGPAPVKAQDRTHCPRGHEYTPENTRLKNINGYMCRECRACRPMLQRRADAKRSPRHHLARLVQIEEAS